MTRKVLGAAVLAVAIVAMSSLDTIVYAIPNVTYLTVEGLRSTLPATLGFVVFFLGLVGCCCGASLMRYGTLFPPEASK